MEQVKETSARKQDIKIVGPLNKENLSQLAIEIKVKTSSEFCLDLSGITGLTEVGDYCFDKCTNLKDIRLPDTVEIIGNYAFRETGIDKIYFPKSLKKLGDAVYEECLSLTCVEIPGHIEQIGANLFYSCTGILSATLPEGMYEIPKTMFQYCTALMTVNSPESVRIIHLPIASPLHRLYCPIHFSILKDRLSVIVRSNRLQFLMLHTRLANFHLMTMKI